MSQRVCITLQNLSSVDLKVATERGGYFLENSYVEGDAKPRDVPSRQDNVPNNGGVYTSSDPSIEMEGVIAYSLPDGEHLLVIYYDHNDIRLNIVSSSTRVTRGLIREAANWPTYYQDSLYEIDASYSSTTTRGVNAMTGTVFFKYSGDTLDLGLESEEKIKADLQLVSQLKSIGGLEGYVEWTRTFKEYSYQGSIGDFHSITLCTVTTTTSPCHTNFHLKSGVHSSSFTVYGGGISGAFAGTAYLNARWEDITGKDVKVRVIGGGTNVGGVAFYFFNPNDAPLATVILAGQYQGVAYGTRQCAWN